MEYNSYHKAEIYKVPYSEDGKDLILEKIANSKDLPNELKGAFSGGCDWCKWYEQSSDMKKLSVIFPEVVFYIHRTGEDGDDLTEYYYKDGKEQVCEAIITYPPYNPDLLK